MQDGMPKSIFRLPGIEERDARAKPRSRILREGGSRFDLSLPLLQAVDDWASRQRPAPSRNEAIRRLLERGLSL